MNRMALLISAVLTAMVVAVLGGVVYSARATELAKAKTIVQQDVPQDVQQVNSSSGLDAQTQEQIQQTIQQRDAAYQALINEANTRLEQAQQKQQELEAQIAAMQAASIDASTNAAAVAAQPAAPVVTLVSPEQAAQIAAGSVGQTNIYSVESASFNGIPAYKVTFSSGVVAFVSMDGQVLTVQRAKNAQPGKVVARANNQGGGEHEGGGDD
jgi:predicted RNase H-like nuclease (RuvC/YqgF family)